MSKERPPSQSLDSLIDPDSEDSAGRSTHDFDVSTSYFSDEENRIQGILTEEINQGGSIEVSRKQKNGGWAYCAKYPLDEWDLTKQKIAEQFGGGEYRGRVRRAMGTLGPKFLFQIDENLRPKTDTEKGTNAGMDTVKILELVTSKIENQRAPDSTGAMMQMMLTMMTQTMQSMTALMTSVISRPQPPPHSPSDKLIEMAFAKLNERHDSVSELTKLIHAAKQLRGAVDGTDDDSDDKEPDDFFNSLMRALPVLIEKLPMILPGQAPAEKMIESAPVAPAVVTRPPAEPSNADAEEIDDDEENEDEEEMFRVYVGTLNQYAIDGQDPVVMAENLFAQIPPETSAIVADLFDRDDWAAFLIEAHKPVEMHVGWWTRFREKFLSLTA